MALGRPLRALDVTDAERNTLQEWTRKSKSSQALVLRAKIILLSDKGLANDAVAEKLSITGATVCKWRERFRTARLQGLSDAPRSGPPRQIGDDLVEKVIQKTLTSRPKGGTHWSSREMAAQTGLSQSTIIRMWKTFGLQPHRSEKFKLSKDPLFIEKVRDVVGLYLSPPENAIILCVDEKSQIQALDRLQPIFPMRPGIPERQSHDYKRHGVTSLFAALNIGDGKVISALHRRHRHTEFLSFLRKINREVDPALAIHLILDNYGTHKQPKVRAWLGRHPRFELHFIPTSSSWLNQVERFFAEITRKRIRRGTFTSIADLERAIEEYLIHHNRHAKPFIWTASADSIFAKIYRTYATKS